MARLNNDIAEIQRVAAEAALAWVGNVFFLVGSVTMIFWLDWRLSMVAAAALPLSLWALGRYRRLLEARVAEIRAAGGEAAGVPLDVRSAASIRAFLDQAERTFGPVDVVVNNAGVAVAGRGGSPGCPGGQDHPGGRVAIDVGVG